MRRTSSHDGTPPLVAFLLSDSSGTREIQNCLGRPSSSGCRWRHQCAEWQNLCCPGIELAFRSIESSLFILLMWVKYAREFETSIDTWNVIHEEKKRVFSWVSILCWASAELVTKAPGFPSITSLYTRSIAVPSLAFLKYSWFDELCFTTTEYSP